MKRSKSLIKLSHEHNQALMLSLGLKKNAPNLKSIPNGLTDKARFAKDFYYNDLVSHFKEEEEILFPFISGKDNEIDEMIPELINDHRMLGAMFMSIDAEKVTADELAAVGDLLRAHIRKEERYLFELIQKNYSDQELESILTKHQ